MFTLLILNVILGFDWTLSVSLSDVEVPAPTLKEKEIPGSEEVEQAEEILGLRQSGVKQETLDGVIHKPNYRKVRFVAISKLHFPSHFPLRHRSCLTM